MFPSPLLSSSSLQLLLCDCRLDSSFATRFNSGTFSRPRARTKKIATPPSRQPLTPQPLQPLQTWVTNLPRSLWWPRPTKSTLSVSLNTPKKKKKAPFLREREREAEGERDSGALRKSFLLPETWGNGKADAGTRITRPATEDVRKYVGFHAVSQEARN